VGKNRTAMYRYQHSSMTRVAAGGFGKKGRRMYAQRAAIPGKVRRRVLNLSCFDGKNVKQDKKLKYRKLNFLC